MRIIFIFGILLLINGCQTSANNVTSSGNAVVVATPKLPPEVDLRINGVGSGTPYAEVVEKFGTPSNEKTDASSASESCSNSPETHVAISYPGLEVRLLAVGDEKVSTVVAMEITSDRWIASGVKIGDTAEQIIRTFGEPEQETIAGRTVFHYVTPENLGGVSFYFENNVLVKIRMAETLC